MKITPKEKRFFSEMVKGAKIDYKDIGVYEKSIVFTVDGYERYALYSPNLIEGVFWTELQFLEFRKPVDEFPESCHNDWPIKSYTLNSFWLTRFYRRCKDYAIKKAKDIANAEREKYFASKA